MERALAALARRNELLRAGSRPVGWKLGVGERERLDGSIAVGHLTSATCNEDGASVVLPDSGALHADAEIAGLATVQLSIAGRSRSPLEHGDG